MLHRNDDRKLWLCLVFKLCLKPSGMGQVQWARRKAYWLGIPSFRGAENLAHLDNLFCESRWLSCSHLGNSSLSLYVVVVSWMVYILHLRAGVFNRNFNQLCSEHSFLEQNHSIAPREGLTASPATWDVLGMIRFSSCFCRYVDHQARVA